jgi:RNase P subunit RPR2
MVVNMKLKSSIKSLFRKRATVNDVKKASKKYLGDISLLKEYLQTLQCPNCKKYKVLVVMNYEMAKYGWEVIVGCSGCGSKGILNPTGLTFKLNVNKILKDGE